LGELPWHNSLGFFCGGTSLLIVVVPLVTCDYHDSTCNGGIDCGKTSLMVLPIPLWLYFNSKSALLVLIVPLVG
jgi:hypothetical protein